MTAACYSDVRVADMMSGALESAAQKSGLQDGAEALRRVRGGDCAVCEYLRAADDAVRAVYIYDPERATDGEGIISSPGISLIAWVSRRSAALGSLIELLRRALLEQREQFVCPRAQALCAALDVQVVDDAQVVARTGYGALLGSLHVRPTEVWRR